MCVYSVPCLVNFVVLRCIDRLRILSEYFYDTSHIRRELGIFSCIFFKQVSIPKVTYLIEVCEFHKLYIIFFPIFPVFFFFLSFCEIIICEWCKIMPVAACVQENMFVTFCVLIKHLQMNLKSWARVVFF